MSSLSDAFSTEDAAEFAASAPQGVVTSDAYASSRVDTDNIASQNLMEKFGFQPYGLSEFLLHREEDKLVAEEEYKDNLDERYMALARKFNVDPRKLLSHVLEYRIVV